MSAHIIVIGGGAAGFFAAIQLAQLKKGCRITLLEKSNKLLSKVRISGGGRCNVTHDQRDVQVLLQNYPRGARELRQVFSRFAVDETISWFESQGMQLKTEPDGRMFPTSDSSQTIIDCFLKLTGELGIEVVTQSEVFAINGKEGGFHLRTATGDLTCDLVICATGGHPKAGSYDLVKNLGHRIEEPIPSLFTFNLPGEKLLRQLQGLSAPSAEVSVKGTKLSSRGPILVTHWGLSGPAVLKLSAFAAKPFFDTAYKADILVNWTGLHPDDILAQLNKLQAEKKKTLPRNTSHFDLPSRLWEHLCEVAAMKPRATWAETGSRQVKALADALGRSSYQMEGKSTFKEEFVTCGGIDLRDVDFRTMESKIKSGVFFCGEALNIDAVTGGFNFQAAWSTAAVCAMGIASRK